MMAEEKAYTWESYKVARDLKPICDDHILVGLIKGKIPYVIIADGVGSKPRGGLCAKLAVKGASENLEEMCAQDGSSFGLNNILAEVILKIVPDFIKENAKEENINPKEFNSLASTLLIAVVANKELVYACAGDGGIYYYRKGKLEAVMAANYSPLQTSITTERPKFWGHFTEGTLALEEGDILFAGSDGLVGTLFSQYFDRFKEKKAEWIGKLLAQTSSKKESKKSFRPILEKISEEREDDFSAAAIEVKVQGDIQKDNVIIRNYVDVKDLFSLNYLQTPSEADLAILSYYEGEGESEVTKNLRQAGDRREFYSKLNLYRDLKAEENVRKRFQKENEELRKNGEKTRREFEKKVGALEGQVIGLQEILAKTPALDEEERLEQLKESKENFKAVKKVVVGIAALFAAIGIYSKVKPLFESRCEKEGNKIVWYAPQLGRKDPIDKVIYENGKYSLVGILRGEETVITEENPLYEKIRAKIEKSPQERIQECKDR